MLKLKSYAHYLIIFGLAMLLMAIGQVGQSHTAWADGTNYQTVPTRTPTPDPSGGSGEPDDSSDQSDESDSSQIVGVVTDLSTGNPGVGIIVRLNDVEVKTDTFGKYSLSSLSAGEFMVSLVLEGEAVSAQEPVAVTIDGSSDVSVDLAYYSDPSQAQAPATPTTSPASATDDSSATQTAATPTVASAAQAVQTSSDTETAADLASTTDESEATANDNPPQLLPTSGQVGYPGWLMFGIGLVALILGLKFSREDRV